MSLIEKRLQNAAKSDNNAKWRNDTESVRRNECEPPVRRLDRHPPKREPPRIEKEEPEAELSRKEVMESAASALLKERLKMLDEEKRTIAEAVDKEIIKITDDERKYVDMVTAAISERFKQQVSSASSISAALADEIEKAVAIECERLPVLYETQQRVKKTVISQIIGLGPLDPYMADPKVTEIVVQRWDHICIEREGKIHRVQATFTDEKHLQTVIQRIVQPIGRQINVSRPIVDARLADGSRVCATIPPASPDGATLDIRRFFDIALTGEDYIRLGSMNEDMLEFLRKAVQAKSSIIVSGGTGTGKTTLLNMLSGAIPEDELIITIEDSCELKLESPNVRRLETRTITSSGKNDAAMNVDIRALVKTSLRMRPDRIVVGEIRDGTITDMISAMSTGHEGSMCTVHANSAVNLVNVRLPMLYSMAEASFSEESEAIQIAEAIDLIVQIKRYGKLRAIQSITEVTGMEGSRVKLTDIFRFDEIQKEYYATGYKPKKILDRMLEKGIYINPDIFKSREVKKKEMLEELDKQQNNSGSTEGTEDNV
jgi:Flp pilus assembly CpaF family ATPase